MKSKKPSSSAFKNCVAGALLCLLFSGRGFYWVIKDSWLALQRQYWPVTVGIVESAKNIKSSGTGKLSGGYTPKVLYRYEVDGQSYQGSIISYPPRRDSKRWAEEVLSKYEVHDLVEVFYDPKNPKTACLERGRLNGFFIGMIGSLSLFFGALGVWLAIIGFKLKTH